MDFVILLGIIITVLGAIVMMLTPREPMWGYSVYRSKNPAMSALAVFLIILGLAIIIVKAWLNGQLG